MQEKEYITIAGNEVEVKENHELPKDADEFTRTSYLIMGRIEPKTESDFKILKEADEIVKRGNSVDNLFN